MKVVVTIGKNCRLDVNVPVVATGLGAVNRAASRAALFSDSLLLLTIFDAGDISGVTEILGLFVRRDMINWSTGTKNKLQTSFWIRATSEPVL